MLQDKTITIEGLTGQENKTYNLNGAGLQIKEIADKMGVAYETVKSYMKSIKVKLDLQKDKEVTAHFWCTLAGENFDEVKKQILKTILILLLIIVPAGARQARGRRMTYQMSYRTSVMTRRNNYAA